jgi:hypothetical protein
MRVRLLRKLAERIDGVDLSNQAVGDVMDLPAPKAQLLIAEGWAAPERRTHGFHDVLAFRRTTDPGPFRHFDEDDVSQAS